MKITRLCIVALMAAGLSFAALAGEAIVNTEVSVDVTGKDASDARDQAMAKGQLDGLTDLLGKLAPPGQTQQIIESLDTKKIAAMVRGTEVLDEKISGERYRARLLISFDADAISSLVGKFGARNDREEAGATATSSFLIIPSFQDGSDTVLWEDKNPWRSAWKSLALEVISGDIVVPYGDNTDINVIDTKTLTSANYASLAPLAIRYGVSDIVILQATYTKNPDMVLNVVKRRINRTRNEVNMLTYRADAQETRDVLLARAARDIVDNLQNKKHEEIATTKGMMGGERNKVMVLASVTTLNSWTQLKGKLQALPMIDRMELLAISPQQVDMIIYYRGTPDSLISGIARQKLRVVENTNYWVVSRD